MPTTTPSTALAVTLSLLTGVARAAEPAFTIPISATLGFAEPPKSYSGRFGDPTGPDWLSVGGGAAFTGPATDANAYVMWHTFITQDFEFSASLGGWYFFQDGDDAGGVNPALGFRWHFVNKDRFSIYAELGVGLLASTDDVPDDGTSFNFTPRAGFGATIALGEGERSPRLDVGIRWHHVSNASAWGSDDNPSRDSVMFYVGVMFPL